MKKKKQKMLKRVEFKALGFPIILRNVPQLKMRGEWVMDIDYNALQKTVLILLCHKQKPLTGNEIAFIRAYFSLSAAEFGTEFGVSGEAVQKWEKSGNRYSKIEPAIDLCIRFLAFEKLHCKEKSFQRLRETVRIQELAKLQKKSSVRMEPLTVDLQEEAVVNF